MSLLEAAGFYAALNILIMLGLAYNVSRHRRRAQVKLGVGEDEGLLQASRAHGNAAEHVPAGLILLLCLALLEAPSLVLHAAGASLTVGRGLHAYGLLSSAGVTMGRFLGTLLTWLMLALGSLYLLYMILTGLSG